jgi:hypothetical protein
VLMIMFISKHLYHFQRSRLCFKNGSEDEYEKESTEP